MLSNIESEINIPVGPHTQSVKGTLKIPENPKGIVIFAHGSGSNRFSNRNQYIASKLNNHNFATLLLDLLTTEEFRIDSLISQYRFNVSLQSNRLIEAIDLVANNRQTDKLQIGLFGASTGAAVALLAASERPKLIGAIVSRGGVLDSLTENNLRKIISPTLFIVGEFDHQSMSSNEKALNVIGSENQKDLRIVRGAGHLFEESDAIDVVVVHTVQWFVRYLKGKNSENKLT